MKIAATWFRFTKFNGSSTNIFGVGPGTPTTSARDLDDLLITASVAF